VRCGTPHQDMADEIVKTVERYRSQRIAYGCHCCRNDLIGRWQSPEANGVVSKVRIRFVVSGRVARRRAQMDEARSKALHRESPKRRTYTQKVTSKEARNVRPF
jgi:hypothetical protein